MTIKKSKIFYDNENKVWKPKSSSKSNGLFNGENGLGFIILELFRNTPERITQVCADNGVEMTCYEMRVRTIKITSHLIKCGYEQNDVVGIIASNSENLAPVVFACLTLGMPINTLAPVMLESDILQMYSKTRPKVVFCDADIIETLKSAMEKIKLDCEIITLRHKVKGFQFVDELLNETIIDEEEFEYPKLTNVSDSIAFIICSSGSTASPKAIPKSHKQLICHFTNRFISKHSDQDVNFIYSTIYWITGVAFLLIGSMYGSKRVITTKTYTPEHYLGVVKKFGVTSSFIPPSGIAEFIAITTHSEAEKVLNSVRLMLLGGAHVSNYLRQSVKKYFPNAKLVVGYGNCALKYEVNFQKLNNSRFLIK